MLLQYAFVKRYSIVNTLTGSRKPDISRFFFSMHFIANRFTFEKFASACWSPSLYLSLSLPFSLSLSLSHTHTGVRVTVTAQLRVCHHLSFPHTHSLSLSLPSSLSLSLSHTHTKVFESQTARKCVPVTHLSLSSSLSFSLSLSLSLSFSNTHTHTHTGVRVTNSAQMRAGHHLRRWPM